METKITSSAPGRSVAAAVMLATALISCAGSATGPAEERAAPDPPAATVAGSPPTTDPGRSGGEQSFGDGGLLTPAARYRAAGRLQDIDVTFTAPSTPLYGFAGRRFVGISSDEEGIEMELALLPAVGVRVFPSPHLQPADLTAETLGTLTADTPADVVAWLAGRPFLRAGPIDDHMRVGALNGRGFAYEVGELPAGAQACGPTAAHRCAATLWANGVMFHMAPGERGRVLEIDVAGQSVIAMIRDHPATAALLSTLHLEVEPVPEAAAGATRLPYFTPALDAGTRYYIDKIANDVGLVVTATTDPVTASQRSNLAWFGDPGQSPSARHYYLTVMDATTVVANDDPSLDPYALLSAGGIKVEDYRAFLARIVPMPADPLQWLAERSYVAVERPPHDAQVAGFPARVIDVRAARSANGIPCPDGEGSCVMPFARGVDAFPVVISTEYVTRVVDVTIGDNRMLIAADMDTPGESLLASLRALEAVTADT